MLVDPDMLGDARLSADACAFPGGSGAFRKRLAIPDLMIPGCRPSRGASREIVPNIRCLRWGPYTALGEG